MRSRLLALAAAATAALSLVTVVPELPAGAGAPSERPAVAVAVRQSTELVLVDTGNFAARRLLATVEGGRRIEDVYLSVDGKTAYYTVVTPDVTQIFSVPTEGGPTEHVADGRSLAESHDGRYLAYVYNHGPLPWLGTGIAVRDRNSGVERLYPNTLTEPGCGPCPMVANLTWTRGRWLVFTLGTDRGGQLYALDPDTDASLGDAFLNDEHTLEFPVSVDPNLILSFDPETKNFFMVSIEETEGAPGYEPVLPSLHEADDIEVDSTGQHLLVKVFTNEKDEPGRQGVFYHMPQVGDGGPGGHGGEGFHDIAW